MDGMAISPKDKTTTFLAELTELSRKYGLGINDQSVIFEMVYEDHGLDYSLAPNGKLFLGQSHR